MKKLTPSCALALIALVAALPGTALAQNGSGPGDPPTQKKGALAVQKQRTRAAQVVVTGGAVIIAGDQGRIAYKAHRSAVDAKKAAKTDLLPRAPSALDEKTWAEFEKAARTEQGIEVRFTGKKMSETAKTNARFVNGLEKEQDVHARNARDAAKKMQIQESDRVFRVYAEDYVDRIQSRHGYIAEQAQWERTLKDKSWVNHGLTESEVQEKLETAKRRQAGMEKMAQERLDEITKRIRAASPAEQKRLTSLLAEVQGEMSKTYKNAEMIAQSRANIAAMKLRPDGIGDIFTIRLAPNESLRGRISKMAAEHGKEIALLARQDESLLLKAARHAKVSKIAVGATVLSIIAGGTTYYMADQKIKEIEAESNAPTASSQLPARAASQVE